MSVTSRWALSAVAHVQAHCSGPELDRTLRITLNFHPDREVAGVPILESMRRDGRYRSQFETGTSNGGLTAYPGGARWHWEGTLFGSAYDDAPPAERPKYGALNHRPRPLGGAPRFGSALLRLREHMLDRATFCFPDSAFRPSRFATAQSFDLLSLPAEHDATLTRDPEGDDVDPLDGYIEAQVHGQVRLVDDVEALVLDPCYRGTSVEETASRLGVTIEWHEGRVLTVSALSSRPAYRGPEPLRIGAEIAVDGTVDGRIIGDAVRTGRYDPQGVKQLWHHTAQWGSARE